MKDKNVVILTSGLSGSSVLTGLLAIAGYWAGDSTFKKTDYDTFENDSLIRLNKQLLLAAGLDTRYEMAFDRSWIDRVQAARSAVDPLPYTTLINECNRHVPWVWKDPRLWLTIRAWHDWLPLDDIRFIVLDRDPEQAWISQTIRRQIQSRSDLVRHLGSIHDSIVEYLESSSLPYLNLLYEDMILRPEESLARLSDYLGRQLEMEHFARVYRGRFHCKKHGLRDLLTANLIYVKNYRSRVR